MKTEQDPCIVVHIDPELKEQFARRAEALDLSTSQLLRRLIRNYLNPPSQAPAPGSRR